MLEVKNVTKTFDGFKALDGLNMTVEKGSVYGLVGPNGAGKSTIIRHITGVYRPDCGEITMDGQIIYENPEMKKRIASIPDDTVRYNTLRAAFEEVDENRPIRRLSKGMQKQAAFWLALCCNPDLLVLDEPVDGLDPVKRRQVWSLLMSDVAQRGTTVLVSSHNLRELEDVCDHVGILSHGKVLLERSLSDLQDNLVKLQVVFPTAEKPELPADLEVLHESNLGRVYTLIVRGNPAMVKSRMAVYQPILLEALPLSLEEIFIYELGGEDYAVRDIVL